MGPSATPGWSGVKKKIGSPKIKSQTANRGPTIRSGSNAALLTPNQGCAGMNGQSTASGSTKQISMKRNKITPDKLPSASASPESLPTLSSGTSVGSIAL